MKEKKFPTIMASSLTYLTTRSFLFVSENELIVMREFCLCSKSKYWRNNPVELGPSLSGYLDKFASFPRLVCQTNVLNPLLRKGKILSITRESNPAPLG
jgi:hypothetical protein